MRKDRVKLIDIANELDISIASIRYILKKYKEYSDLVEKTEEIQIYKTKRGSYENIRYFVTIPTERAEDVKNLILREYKKGSSTNPMQGWTKTALTCYKNNLYCEQCDLNQYCSNIEAEEPPMKKTVLKLVRQVGKPPMYMLDEV